MLISVYMYKHFNCVVKNVNCVPLYTVWVQTKECIDCTQSYALLVSLLVVMFIMFKLISVKCLQFMFLPVQSTDIKTNSYSLLACRRVNILPFFQLFIRMTEDWGVWREGERGLFVFETELIVSSFMTNYARLFLSIMLQHLVFSSYAFW